MDSLSQFLIFTAILLSLIALFGAIIPLFKSYKAQQAALKRQTEHKELFHKQTPVIEQLNNEEQENQNAHQKTTQRQIISPSDSLQ